MVRVHCPPRCLPAVEGLLTAISDRVVAEGQMNEATRRTFGQLCAEMDGLEDLDPALERPGRFDRKIFLKLPGTAARRAIFAVYLQRTPFGPDVDVNTRWPGRPRWPGRTR